MFRRAKYPGQSPAPELDRFRFRMFWATLVVFICFGLLVARLVWLQVYRHEALAARALSNSTGYVPVVPNRGLIVDRNGIVLATNQPAFTLEITPSQLTMPIERVLDELAGVIRVDTQDRLRFRKLLADASGYPVSVPIRTNLTEEEVARFAARRYRFAGVHVRPRALRSYPWGGLASHAIGYIGRIDEAEKTRMQDDWDEDEEANYRGTDVIGKLGVEESYEQALHGTAGVQEVETAASGRAVRQLARTPAVRGKTLVLTLDARLQKMVEDLYGDRRGALVAMDPATGEVLAFVSMPTFDPNLFIGGIDQASWKALNEAPDKPLLDRALRGTYPPGSTFKPYMALTGLQTGVRTPEQTIFDPGYFWFGEHKFRDDKKGGHGVVDMYKSIVQSCDTYYYMLAADLGVDTIHDALAPFGFGQLTGIDIPGEAHGLLPSTQWKRQAYRRSAQKKWYPGETISLGIGQGYNSFTMLQLATALGTLVNGGVRMKPHLAKALVEPSTGDTEPIAPEPVATLDLDEKNIAVVRHAMAGVNIEGTGRGAFAGAPYTSGGKTGTAQVFTLGANEHYRESELDERRRDHALFIAYAPADKPKVVVALVVENAGFGAAAAAPIARRVLDYEMLGAYPSVEDMAAVQRAEATAPIGEPRTADAAWPPPARPSGSSRASSKIPVQ